MTQVSIFKEKCLRYTPPTNQGWAEKEEGVMMKAAIQNTKLTIYKFISSMKNIQGTQHPLISVGSKIKRGVMIKAAIQNTNKSDTSFNLHRKIFKVDNTH